MEASFETLGLLSSLFLLIWFIIKIVKGLWTCWLGYYLGFGVKWAPNQNNWAVITGATDGIGQEYALQLGQMGYSLLLISRSNEKLQTTEQMILSACKKQIKIQTLEIDFTKQEIYDQIEKKMDELEDIDVLVNNVGMSFNYGEYFTLIPDGEKFINDMINVNCLSATQLIKIVLPKMEKRKRGIIINISSVSASHPVPLLSLYSSTKVYLDFLSRSIEYEYRNKGIVIQSVKPAFVSTKMSKFRPSLTVPKASDYVKGALKTVGIETQTYGYWIHKLQGFVQDNIIGSYFSTLLTFKTLDNLRIKYYRRHKISK